MGDNNDNKIPIHGVAGGGHGPDLLNCYFTRNRNGTFDFFDKDGDPKHENIKIGAVFMFSLDEVPDVLWALSIADGSDTLVSGSWASVPAPPGIADEPDQTYTAQAGTPVDEKEGAASASAY